MAVRVYNISPGPLVLPAPYHGVVAPGSFAIVKGTKTEVIAAFGGASQLRGVVALFADQTADANVSNSHDGNVDHDGRGAIRLGGSDAAYYGAANWAWLDIDGTNPPTMAAFRLVDQVTGLVKTITLENGTLTVS